METNKVSPQRLIDEARALIGTPFLHQGRTRAGVDCIGFVNLVTANAGINVPEVLGVTVWNNYGRSAQPGLIEMFEKHGERIPSPIPGSVILFRFTGAKYPQHAALYTERVTMIHAYARRPVLKVVENSYRGAWLRWTHSVWKVPQVDYA